MKTFFGKILDSKLSKNERSLFSSYCIVLGFLTPAVALFTIYVLYQQSTVTNLLNMLFIYSITFGGISIYGVYLHFKYKKLVVKEQNTFSEQSK